MRTGQSLSWISFAPYGSPTHEGLQNVPGVVPKHHHLLFPKPVVGLQRTQKVNIVINKQRIVNQKKATEYVFNLNFESLDPNIPLSGILAKLQSVEQFCFLRLGMGYKFFLCRSMLLPLWQFF